MIDLTHSSSDRSIVLSSGSALSPSPTLTSDSDKWELPIYNSEIDEDGGVVNISSDESEHDVIDPPILPIRLVWDTT